MQLTALLGFVFSFVWHWLYVYALALAATWNKTNLFLIYMVAPKIVSLDQMIKKSY